MLPRAQGKQVRVGNAMMTTQTRTKAASTPDAAMAAHPTAGQAQQHHAEWKYGGDNRVSWAPLRADLNDLVEAAWQQQLPSVSYQLLAGKEYQVDFASMQQTNTTTKYKRALRRFLAPSSPLPSHIWSWETDDGGSLIPFDDDLCAYLSMARSRPRSSLLPSPDAVIKLWATPTVSYSIDVRNLVQMNVATGRLRWVSVRAAATPAVASLQALAMEEQAAAVMNRCEDVTDEVVEGEEGGGEGEEEVCAVCIDGFGADKPAWRLPGCQHYFHDGCIRPWLLKAGSCPTCAHRYVERQGDQPDGQMLCFVYPPGSMPLSGYEQQGTLLIQYKFPSGIQLASMGHPSPGAVFPGTTRVAYLPDTPEGWASLLLLRRCFNRKLMFTIGTSATTGRHGQIVWNGVHMKTSPSGGAAHYGYPDPAYFQRLRDELRAKGIR